MSIIKFNGIIDSHSFINNFKNLDKLLKESLDGGITDVVAFGEDDFLIDNEMIIDYLKIKSKLLKYADLHIVGSAFSNKDEHKLSEQSIMYNSGIVAIGLKSDIHNNTLLRTFEYAHNKNKPLLIDTFNRELANNGVISDGHIATKLGLPVVISLTSSSEIAKIAEFAYYFKQPVLLQTIWNKRSCELIKKLKKDNPYIYAEVSIHHLLLNDSNCNNFNSNAKLMPPLGTKSDQKALLKAIQDGTIDIITSLHQPRSLSSKDIPFDIASYGINCASYYLPLLYNELIVKNIITIEQLNKLVSKNPAKIFKITSNKIVKLDTNNITIVPDGINSPYCGMKLQGRVVG